MDLKIALSLDVSIHEMSIMLTWTDLDFNASLTSPGRIV